MGGVTTVLCGRDSVQVAATTQASVDLDALAARLAGVAPVAANRWMVRAEIEPGIELVVFADGRALVGGTRDEARARTIVARYLG